MTAIIITAMILTFIFGMVVYVNSADKKAIAAKRIHDLEVKRLEATTAQTLSMDQVRLAELRYNLIDNSDKYIESD